MLHERGVRMEAKPFSIGFRIEHPQGLIDRARFGPNAGNAILGAADYKLVHHASNGRSVYSFCMCPGGTVVAATSEAGRVVTNGMSQYSRNERNANAGIVVGITPQDYRQDGRARRPGEPARRHRLPAPLGVARVRARRRRLPRARRSSSAISSSASARRAFGSVLPSYKPGVRLTDLAEPGRGSLPDYALDAIREALPAFERQIKGFSMPDAVLTGVETRTSSPLRIPRGKDYQSLNVARPLSGRRRRGLCGRDHVGGRRRHRGRRGARRGHAGLAHAHDLTPRGDPYGSRDAQRIHEPAPRARIPLFCIHRRTRRP